MEEVSLGLGEAIEAPDEGGDVGEENALEGGAGAEDFFELVTMGLEGERVFSVEVGVGVGDAVFQGVFGDFFLSCGGAGAGGFLGVGAVGGEAFGGDWRFEV